MCSAEKSVTIFIQQLQAGERSATEGLWEHFYSRLVSLARARLSAKTQRVVDGEDVALDALNTCFRRLEEGLFPSIQDRDNLWALLATITERKASNANRDLNALKRGRGQIRGESVFLIRESEQASGISGVVGSEPTADMIALFAEEFDGRLRQLNESEKSVAIRKLEGLTNQEIAESENMSLSSVERKLQNIRRKWSD